MDRREYYRVRAPARVDLRVVPEERLEEARADVRTRHVPSPVRPGTLDERSLTPESRILLDVLHRMSMALARIDARLEVLSTQNGTHQRASRPDPIDVSLSGTGIALPFEAPAEVGTLVGLTLDVCDPTTPLIPALARVVRIWTEDDRRYAALRFDEIHPEDQERLVQFSLRQQSAELRERRTGEAQ